MKKKRESSPFAEMKALVKALDKLPREEAAQITAPLLGPMLKGLLQSVRNQNLQPENRRDAEHMIKRARVWLTHLRDSGTAPQDLARM